MSERKTPYDPAADRSASYHAPKPPKRPGQVRCGGCKLLLAEALNGQAAIRCPRCKLQAVYHSSDKRLITMAGYGNTSSP